MEIEKLKALAREFADAVVKDEGAHAGAAGKDRYEVVDSPVVRLANVLIVLAIEQGADGTRIVSDAHHTRIEAKAGDAPPETLLLLPSAVFAPLRDRLGVLCDVPARTASQRVRAGYCPIRHERRDGRLETTIDASAREEVVTLRLLPKTRAA